MKALIKVLWGIATVMSVGMLAVDILLVMYMLLFVFASLIQPFHRVLPPEAITHFFHEIAPFRGPIIGGILLGFLIQASYFVHLVRSDHLNKAQRTLWAVLFLFFHALAMVPYWFIHVLLEPESKSKSGRK